MMSTSNRISHVFRSAREVPFDDSSKIVIMSDCHRGDGSWADTFAKNQSLFFAALNKYNREEYTYIELGDGDELWENKNLSDIISNYKNIFLLMSQFYNDGRLYLLFGNHDIVKQNIGSGKHNSGLGEKEYFSLFPNIKIYEGLMLRHTPSGNKIFLLHGHQADFLNGPLWKLSRFLVRYLWKPLETIGVNDLTSTSKNDRRVNIVEKKLIQWTDKERQTLIAGHTHRSVFPEPGRSFYFNDGSCVHLHFITAIEIVHGNISLVRWSNKTKSDGTIYVGRDVLAGPKKLRDYFDAMEKYKNRRAAGTHSLEPAPF